MTDHPTPFSAPMIRALLEGRKTQTRRVLKPQPSHIDDELIGIVGRSAGFDDWRSGKYDIKIFHAPGDRLWVREAWKTDLRYDDLAPSEMGGEEPLLYMADNAVERWGWKPDALSSWGRHRAGRHMPRWASRLTLIVTDVRVQRVQRISAEDCNREGIEYSDGDLARDGYMLAGRNYFRTLWDNLNAKRGFGWDANPWVVATTFTVHHVNIDQMEAA